MNVLVIGGTRFIGRRAVGHLVAHGHTVTLVHRGLHDASPVPGVTHLHGDRADLATLLPAGGRWDAVLDCVALRPALVDSTRAALAGRVGRVVQVGSMSVYHQCGPAPLTENFPRWPCTAEEALDTTMDTYCQRKAECERRGQAWADAEGLPFVVGHPGIVIGHGDDTDRVDAWIRGARAGVVVAAPFDLAPLVWVDDVARALVALVEGAGVGAYNLSLPGQRTLARWLAALRHVLRVDFRVDPAPADEVPGVQTEDAVTVSVDRAIADLHFAPHPVETALREIVEAGAGTT